MITLALGVIMGGAAWVGGAPVTGALLFGLMVITTIAVRVATARSERFRETFEADERWGVVDMQAGRLAAIVMLAILLAGSIYELARGHALDPIAALALGIGGMTYTGAQVFLSRRL